MGTGRVGGKWSAVGEGNMRFVEDSPCRVKGRSRNRAGSDGPASGFSTRPESACCCSLVADWGRRSFFLSGFSSTGGGACRVLAVGEPVLMGSCVKPGRAKASLKAGLVTAGALGCFFEGVVGS